MTAAADKAKADRAALDAKNPRLVVNDVGVLRAVWPTWTVRYLFEGGGTVDLVTALDDSRLRGVLVERYGAIVGSTKIPDAEARPAP